MQNDRFNFLVAKYLSGEIQEAEQDELYQMLQDKKLSQQFKWLQTTWHGTEPFNIGEGKLLTMDKIAQEDESIVFGKKEFPMQRKTYQFNSFLKIAASIILVVSLGYLYINTQTRQNDEFAQSSWKITETSSGQLSTITFSDGSKAVLNGESKLSRPSIFSDSLRIVELEGEAYFEIAKDKNRPFIVKTKHVSTRVLGTKFNVSAFPIDGNVTVSLLEGSVKVYDNEFEGKETEQYVPEINEQVVINTNSKTARVIDIEPENVVGWKDNIFKFDNVKMEKVLRSIKRRYGVTFEVKNKNINNCLIKTRFNNASLEAVLEAITFATNSTYEISEHKIIITGKGCDK